MVRRTRKAVQWGPMGGGGYLHCTPHPLDPVHDFILQVRRMQPPVTVVSSTSGLPNAMPRCRNTTVSVGFSKLCCRTGGGRGGGGSFGAGWNRADKGSAGVPAPRTVGRTVGRPGRSAGRPADYLFHPGSPPSTGPLPGEPPPLPRHSCSVPSVPSVPQLPEPCEQWRKGMPSASLRAGVSPCSWLPTGGGSP